MGFIEHICKNLSPSIGRVTFSNRFFASVKLSSGKLLDGPLVFKEKNCSELIQNGSKTAGRKPENRKLSAWFVFNQIDLQMTFSLIIYIKQSHHVTIVLALLISVNLHAGHVEN